MNIHQLQTIAHQQGWLFSLQQIRIHEPRFLRGNLVRRRQQWYIKRITKWRYYLADIQIHEEVLYAWSNRIYTPSYVSTESALRYYDLIPEWVYMITACTSKKTQTLSGDQFVFSYAHLKPELMRWYQLIQTGSSDFLIAQVEKALCDFLYLTPSLTTKQDMLDLRIDVDHLLTLTTRKRLTTCGQQFHNKRVQKCLSFLLA